MGVGRNFSRGGNVDILHIIFKLLTMQCKWTFTKRFTLSTPQRKWPTVTITKKCASLAAIPRTQVCYDSLQYTVGQGLQPFLSEGHISYYSKVWGLEIIVIRNVSISGWATFYQINMFFVTYIIFSLLTKCLRGPDKMALPTGFGPCAVACRPLQ